MDVQKQIDYWSSGAQEDLGAARSLLERQHFRHALFFAELAVEKMLKAHVVSQTCTIAPRTHDLLRLAELAGVPLSEERRQFLARVQGYCLEGRYPEHRPPMPSREERELAFRQCQETVSWLTTLFN